MADVFISYHVKSAGPLARQIVGQLESGGVSCWYSERDVPPGKDFADVIERRIQECHVFLLILDQDAVKSKHIRREVGFADEYDKEILPYQTEEAAVTGRMKYFLKNIQIMRPANPLDANNVRKLIDIIDRTVNEQRIQEEFARQEEEYKALEETARQEVERKALEETARQEAERKALEEAARQEAERKALEEAAQQEAERKALKEAARQEAERKALEEAAQLEEMRNTQNAQNVERQTKPDAMFYRDASRVRDVREQYNCKEATGLESVPKTKTHNYNTVVTSSKAQEINISPIDAFTIFLVFLISLVVCSIIMKFLGSIVPELGFWWSFLIFAVGVCLPTAWFAFEVFREKRKRVIAKETAMMSEKERTHYLYEKRQKRKQRFMPFVDALTYIVVFLIFQVVCSFIMLLIGTMGIFPGLDYWRALFVAFIEACILTSWFLTQQ